MKLVSDGNKQLPRSSIHCQHRYFGCCIYIYYYHFLTTVDLPFFLCWQSKHVCSVLLCEVQFILGQRKEKIEREEIKAWLSEGTYCRNTRCSEEEHLLWSCTHHQLSEHGVQLLKGGHRQSGLQYSHSVDVVMAVGDLWLVTSFETARK